MTKTLSEELLLYAITCEGTDLDVLTRQVESALQGGATMIQLREKTLGTEEYLRKALAVAAICRRHGAPFIVDDSLEVAVKSGADGIHVGQDDVSVAEARAALGADKIIGVSAKTVEQALAAEASGADYLGVGAIYPTKTKEKPIMTSVERLAEICAATRLPVVAIGGIKKDRLSPLRGTGIVGVAVVTGIFAAPDVRRATEELRAATEEILFDNRRR